MEIIGKSILFVGKLIVFAFFSLIFIPSFLVVNYLQDAWSKMLEEVLKF